MLNDLAIKYDTDKSNIWHGYCERYEYYFEKIRNDTLNVMEIGVLDGGSVKMWKDYFPNSKIIGVDNNAECKQYEDERIEIIIGDQSHVPFLESLSSRSFDIIIDDGDHIPGHQIKEFEYLFKYLNPGGIYAIEDLHTNYFSKGSMYDDGFNSIEFLKKLVEDANFNGKNEKNVFVGDKKKHLEQIKQPCFLSYYEQWVKSVHFYRSIAFVLKENA